MKNIVIVGFMGTGKSAVAREIVNALGLDYLNTDEMIERKAGMSVNDIFLKTFLFEKYKGWSTKKENIYDKIHFLI